jgi:polysaccharide export outer membrane protein
MKLAYPALHLTCAVLAMGLGAATLAAQQPDIQPPATAPVATPSPVQPVPTPTQAQPGDPALTLRDQKMLESFEPSVHEEYTLGGGDEITLDFPGRPELSGKRTVGPDGRITLLDAGEVQVADLTRDGASKAIYAALSKYYTDPTVTVSVDKYSSNRVRVIGYVQHPGEILFEDTPTLLDAIGRAGLISPIMNVNGFMSNTGPGVPETCTIYRGNSTAVQVKLRELLVTGNALADIRLRRNDIVYVPEPKQQYVSVLGQVGKPGTIPITSDSTLVSILAQAGCCGDNGGYNPTLHIISTATGKDFKIAYNKAITIEGQKEYTIHSGDVIYIPVSGFNKVTGVLQKVSGVATMVSFAALLGAG